jgi:hypothetical protein
MMLVTLPAQWTFFFPYRGLRDAELPVNVASRSNLQQLSQASMTLESILLEAQW